MKSTIFNVHIPKTAGSTLRRQASWFLPRHPATQSVLGVDMGDALSDGYHAYLRERARAMIRRLRPDALQMISGHYRYRDIADLVGPIRPDVMMVTSVRDPVERTLSEFFFSRSPANTGYEGHRRRYPDFERYMADPRQMNKQMACLQPWEGATLDQTLAAIRGDFDFVFVTERFDRDLAAFTAALGLDCPPAARINVGPGGAAVARARAEYREELERILADDIALYHAIVEDPDRTRAAPGRADPSAGSGGGAGAGGSAGAQADNDLGRAMAALGPWHHRIRIRDWIHTGAGDRRAFAPPGPPMVDPAADFRRHALPVLPGGLAGKSFLDCRCDAGGYCFAARDLGAVQTLGLDDDPRRIRQAIFVAANRSRPSDGMAFRVGGPADLAGSDQMFDVTWFGGLFHRLANPVAALRIAAARTRGTLFVDTDVAPLRPVVPAGAPAVRFRLDPDRADRHRIHATPSGPATLCRLLTGMGLAEIRVLCCHRPQATGGPARMLLAAARGPGS